MTALRVKSLLTAEEAFELTPSGAVQPLVLPAEQFAGTCGFGDLRKTGVMREREIFAAIYSLDDALHVRVADQCFQWPGPFVAKRQPTFTRLKRFSISHDSNVLVSFHYTFIDSHHEWPGPEVVDIFKMIAVKTENAVSVRQTIIAWAAMAKGEDIGSERVQAALAAAASDVKSP